ncbi:hypothetical protein M426DRAFT_14768 [Hypoxylon sp. CI-4A]|nr:hypothetical protein M426DRAFT_14768 [Hypoxylon sp. CI-4A]
MAQDWQDGHPSPLGEGGQSAAGNMPREPRDLNFDIQTLSNPEYNQSRTIRQNLYQGNDGSIQPNSYDNSNGLGNAFNANPQGFNHYNNHNYDQAIFQPSLSQNHGSGNGQVINGHGQVTMYHTGQINHAHLMSNSNPQTWPSPQQRPAQVQRGQGHPQNSQPMSYPPPSLYPNLHNTPVNQGNMYSSFFDPGMSNTGSQPFSNKMGNGGYPVLHQPTPVHAHVPASRITTRPSVARSQGSTPSAVPSAASAPAPPPAAPPIQTQTAAPPAGQQPVGPISQYDHSNWPAPEGCQGFFRVENPPTTKKVTFKELLESGHYADYSYTVRHDTHAYPLLPNRSTRLPCELQTELSSLTERINDTGVADAEKARLEAERNALLGEEVIVAEVQGPPPPPPVIRARTRTKRKRSAMDSTANPENSPVGSDDENNSTDRKARRIKESRRPTDSLEAIEYDVINILWLDPKKPPTEVREMFIAFGDYVTSICGKGKDLRNKIDKAEEDESTAELDSLKGELTNLYEQLRAAIDAALEYGDDYTVAQLGSHVRLLSNLCTVLRLSFATGNFNGRLPKAILQLFSCFTTVTKEFWSEKLKFNRMYEKYKDSVDEEGTRYIELLLANAEKRSAQNSRKESRADAPKGEDGKKVTAPVLKKAPVSTTSRDTLAASKASPLKKEPALKKAATEVKKIQPTDYSGLGSARKVSNVAKATPSLAPSKRPRDDDGDSRAPKKAAVENVAGVPSTSKVPATSATASSQASSATNAQARARPSGSMLPGSRSRVSSKPQPKKPSGSISNLLAEIAKPKESPKQQPEEVPRAPETEKEKEKRLRKESRRHLHVAWKPEPLLTEVKIFEHDIDEDKGRDDNMLRDARDNRSEGQALKENNRALQERLGSGESDEDDQKEVSWYSPTLAVVPNLPLEQQEKIFETRGGKIPVDSPQAAVMRDYESRVLMTHYTSDSEIPKTPQSPTGKIAETFSQPKTEVLLSTMPKWHEGLPDQSPDKSANRREYRQRWSEHAHGGGLDYASRNAQYRAVSSPKPQGGSTNKLRPRTEHENAGEVLALLKSEKVKNYSDPHPYDPANPKTQRRHDYTDPKVQQNADALEDVFAKFSGKPFPPTEPPEHIRSNPERVAEWHDGRSRGLAMKAKQGQPQAEVQPQAEPPQSHDDRKIFDALQQIKIIQAGQVQPVPLPAPQPTQAAMTSPAGAPNLTAVQQLLAGLGVQAPTPASVPIPTTTPAQQDTTNLASILAALQQSNSTANTANTGYFSWPTSQNQGTQNYGGYGYNTQQYGDASQSHSQSQASTSREERERASRKDSHRGAKDHKGINRSLIGTKPCTFWAKGQCAKGDKCTFRHDPNDLA